jgi:hypothetical protein
VNGPSNGDGGLVTGYPSAGNVPGLSVRPPR